MKLLFVTPNTGGTGEAITALHMAERLDGSGFEVGFLASEFTVPFLAERFGDAVWTLDPRPGAGDGRWREAADRFRAEVIVFADYPLLYSSPTGLSVVRSGWVERARDRGAVLVTLDHLGMAQRPGVLYFGPPHLGISAQRLPELPDGMQVLLPCPVHEPAPVEGRVGTPFRYWEPPLRVEAAARASVRSRYLREGDGLLVFHSVPGWARRYAELHGLPHYRCLARILGSWLGRAPRPVTVVSVNGGALLGGFGSPGVRFVDTAALPKDRYQEILLSADLMITDNRISVSLGKAVCGLVPCVALRNSFSLAELTARVAPSLRELLMDAEAECPGAVFPFEVFPLWARRDLDQLGLAGNDCAASAAAAVELYGGEESAARVLELLGDPRARRRQIDRERGYCDRLSTLPGPVEVIERVATAASGRA